VINVIWFDAVRYCNWLSEQTGLSKVYTIEGEVVTADWHADGYRLPTEAEWEFAARGGNLSKGYQYAGSDNLDEVGWFEGYKTNPVGGKKPNELGLYDMSGNVWEWCWDWYGEAYYTDCHEEGIVRDPLGPDNGECRVLRGGSWLLNDFSCRSADRVRVIPDLRFNFNGFRVSRHLSLPF
jgi:formylglycine-generating enzyme required for sulfatase activity